MTSLLRSPILFVRRCRSRCPEALPVRISLQRVRLRRREDDMHTKTPTLHLFAARTCQWVICKKKISMYVYERNELDLTTWYRAVRLNNFMSRFWMCYTYINAVLLLFYV